MDDLWPWLTLAAAGALHGLNPLTGWLFVAARGGPAGERARTWRALVPIAVGHLASIGVVAVAVALGRSLDRTMLQAAAAAAGLLIVVSAMHWRARCTKRARLPTSHTGLALWSFIASTGHGAGLTLVPALIPLCAAVTPGRVTSASGSLAMAAAAVCVHTVAMLAASGAAAALAHHLRIRGARRLSAIRRGLLSSLPARSG